MRRIILGAALNILTGVAPNLTAHASSEDLTDLIQNAECRDGYETQTNKLNSFFVLMALPCGNDARTRSNIIVTVPRCDGEPKIQERNVKAGHEYFRVLADHARQSFRFNKAGYAAYARYAIDEPFYSECATP